MARSCTATLLLSFTLLNARNYSVYYRASTGTWGIVIRGVAGKDIRYLRYESARASLGAYSGTFFLLILWADKDE